MDELIISKDTVIKSSDLLTENINIVQNIIINSSVNLQIVNVITNKNDEKINYKKITNILVKEKASLSIINIQLLNDKSYFEEEVIVDLEKNAIAKYIDIELGAKEIKTKYVTNLNGEASKENLKSIYLGISNQIIDINHVSNHFGQKTYSLMETKGALMDMSNKKYKGVVDFKKGSKEANGSEIEQTILLSDKVINNSIPILLCHEDDVQGAHAASAGKIDEEILFYIMSRGFSEIEAKKLIIKASFESIINDIKEELKERITKEIDRRLK